jgi:predicted dehydrogenase
MHSERPYRFVVWGLGGAGQRFVRAITRAFPGSTIHAIREKHATPALEEDFSVVAGCPAEEYLQVEKVFRPDELGGERYNWGIIATPTAHHARNALTLAPHADHLLVEKPLALSFHEGTELLCGLPRACRVYVNYQRRLHPALSDLVSLLKSGELGELRSVRGRIMSDVRTWHPYEDWRGLYAVRNDLGGGALRTECHELDLLLWLLGEPTRVFARAGAQFDVGQDVELSYSAQLEFNTCNFAGSVDLEVSMLARPERKLRFEFADGVLEVDLQQGSVNKSSSAGDHAAAYGLVSADALYRMMLAALVEPGTSPVKSMLATATDSLPVLRTIDALHESLRSGSWVQLNGGDPWGSERYAANS